MSACRRIRNACRRIRLWSVCLLATGLLLPCAAAPKNSRPRLGAVLPAPTLPDLSGRKHSFTEAGTQPGVLFFFCGCPPCHETARLWSQVQQSGELAAKTAPGKPSNKSSKKPATTVVFLGAAAQARAFAAETGLDPAQTLILLDPTDRAGQDFGVVQCPRAFVTNSAHRLTYTNPDQGRTAAAPAPSALVSEALTAWRRLPSPQTKALP